MYSLDKSIESKFNDLKLAIKEDKGRWISSQGVNAVIVVYPPEDEKEYLKRVKQDYSQEYIIDISSLFVELIDYYGPDNFKTMYKDFKSTPDQVFADQSTEEEDLFSLIIREIKTAKKENKMPILIRTGILYGTGIRNKDILENREISQIKRPLIVFYPGEIREDVDDKERVYFLGTIKASDYRGHFI